MSSNFPSSGDENLFEPFRSTKDSDSSDLIVAGHYEGKTLVDFIALVITEREIGHYIVKV